MESKAAEAVAGAAPEIANVMPTAISSMAKGMLFLVMSNLLGYVKLGATSMYRVGFFPTLKFFMKIMAAVFSIKGIISGIPGDQISRIRSYLSWALRVKDVYIEQAFKNQRKSPMKSKISPTLSKASSSNVNQEKEDPSAAIWSEAIVNSRKSGELDMYGMVPDMTLLSSVLSIADVSMKQRVIVVPYGSGFMEIMEESLKKGKKCAYMPESTLWRAKTPYSSESMENQNFRDFFSPICSELVKKAIGRNMNVAISLDSYLALRDFLTALNVEVSFLIVTKKHIEDQAESIAEKEGVMKANIVSRGWKELDEMRKNSKSWIGKTVETFEEALKPDIARSLNF
jgi:hypothetical protein